MSPDSVVITVGGASALFMITFVLCTPDDDIVVTAPNFPPTLEVMRAVGVRRGHLVRLYLYEGLLYSLGFR